MTDQYPLTDEMCYDMGRGYSIPDKMRVAANWQLEQVKVKVESEIKAWRQKGFGSGAVAVEFFFEEIMRELRPQQQQEDN